eukprot:gnl/MRDRNA2_/MRDRNA2_565735_c0_seq1.p1 gnl/MRDRNA2_/MRDRNA2_565735_c0~~gnl/MRDRNA2_/MRDRNA2_565735_c0_seq1.p1  ORF type:complete len:113 (+),score=15.50 gnl/MRDRNA2_/MRDRNA2_565735_c0_seq1:35-340(+)
MSRHSGGSTDLLSGDLEGILIVSLHCAFEMKDDDSVISRDHLEGEVQILRTFKTGEGPSKLEEIWMSNQWQVGEDRKDEKPLVTVAKQKEFFFCGSEDSQD